MPYLAIWIICQNVLIKLRGVAQSGSASGLGPEGRRFESCLPDHFIWKAMKKKRLTKGEKKVVDKVQGIRIRALQQLKDRVHFLIKRSNELLTKIDSAGVSTNYSVSSDLMRIAEDVYRLELRLAELGLIKYNMEYDYEDKK